MWTATAVKPVSNHARECLGVPLPALLDLQFARQNTLDVIVKTVIFQTAILHMHEPSDSHV